jgi:hypothetical protein
MGCAAPSPFHWADLRARHSEEVLAKPGVKSHVNGQGFEVEFLNTTYLVDPLAERITEIRPKPDRLPSQEFQILLIQYLVSTYVGGALEEDISEKDLPGGVTFFQGPHALYVDPLVRLYGNDPEAFAVRAREMGASEAPYGDKAMRFRPFPLIPVTYVLWREDNEFPASVKVLFDRSIMKWFELDMVFALVLVLTQRIAEL